MKYIIYGLIDPRTLLIRYVGKSSNGLHRVSQHWSTTVNHQTYCGNWIKNLRAAGLKYDYVILESFTDQSTLNDAERWWIAYGRCLGWPLTNLTDGGDGAAYGDNNPMRDPEVVTKVQAARRANGRPWQTDESRAKISAGNKGKTLGRPKSPEHRAKMSANNAMKRPAVAAKNAAKRKGQQYSLETRQKMSEAAIKRCSPDWKARMSEQSRRLWDDPTFRQRTLDGMKTRPKRAHGPCGTERGYDYNSKARRKGLPNCGPCKACKAAAATRRRRRRATTR